MITNEIFYSQPPKKLKLKKPYFRGFENVWEQVSLPLGNGSIGLSLLGDVKKDKLVLNHKTLWTGGPSEKRPDYCGGNISTPDSDGKMPHHYFTEICDEFQKGNDKKASGLCEKLIGIMDGYGAYQCWGNLVFTDKNIRSYSNYKRSLLMDTAVGTVSYNAKLKGCKSCRDTREYFVSYPDKCAVVCYTREDSKLDFTVSLDTEHKGNLEYSNNSFVHKGKLDDNGLQYCLYGTVITDGNVTALGDSLRISDTNEVVIVFSMDTDYMDVYPNYRTGESLENLYRRVKSNVDKATEKSYDALLETHIEDFSELFDRVVIDLDGKSCLHNKTTDELLYEYKKNTADKRTAEQLLYQYGRYLAICSSREFDILPSNLQGIWNCTNSPKWSSDFHLNVNLQMNYWHIYNGNLSECAKPLIRYIKSLVIPGRLTAEWYTNIKSSDNEHNGFLFHTQNTPFGWTCPGWEFNWGWSPAAVPWILHNVFEYYEYTLDKEVLREDIYPMLKETAEYFSKLLVEHNGRLVTVPCFSPEHGPRTMGNTYEQALISQLYDNAITSAKALDIDDEFIEKWKDIQAKLKPYEIGDDGQIKEWYHEKNLGDFGEFHHRHMSHLLGLYPCNVIDWYNNPDLIDAAIISMNHRSDKSTGWSMGQKINTWARVRQGDRVLKIIGDLMNNGIYPNLYDYHPPFQIDGNFGFTSGVNEMLMQSHCGFIHILPALPSDWKNGKITGLVARGNFTLDIEWKDGELITAKITSNMGGKCKIYYEKAPFRVENICESKNGFAEFQTEKGQTFIIKTI